MLGSAPLGMLLGEYQGFRLRLKIISNFEVLGSSHMRPISSSKDNKNVMLPLSILEHRPVSVVVTNDARRARWVFFLYPSIFSWSFELGVA